MYPYRNGCTGRTAEAFASYSHCGNSMLVEGERKRREEDSAPHFPNFHSSHLQKRKILFNLIFEYRIDLINSANPLKCFLYE